MDLLGGTSLVVTDGRVNLGRETLLHLAVGNLFGSNDSVLVLAPDIMRRNVTSENGKVDIGDRRNILEQIGSQLDGGVALVVTPGGGLALGGEGRVRVLAAAERAVAVTLTSDDVLVIHMPANIDRMLLCVSKDVAKMPRLESMVLLTRHIL